MSFQIQYYKIILAVYRHNGNKCQISNFSAISWREQVTFGDMKCPFCTRQTRLAGFFYRASTLK